MIYLTSNRYQSLCVCFSVIGNGQETEQGETAITTRTVLFCSVIIIKVGGQGGWGLLSELLIFCCWLQTQDT